MQLEFGLTLEVTQALLAPMKLVTIGCFDVTHEGREILDPGFVARSNVRLAHCRLPL